MECYYFPFYNFDKNKTVEIGQVSGNVIGINGYGKGIKASYSYLDKHKTGAFYVRSPGLFSNTRTESFGMFQTYRHNEYFNVTGKFGRQVNFLTGDNINSFSILSKLSICAFILWALTELIHNSLKL